MFKHRVARLRAWLSQTRKASSVPQAKPKATIGPRVQVYMRRAAKKAERSHV